VEGGQLKQMYKDIIESYYLAHGEELDFAGDSEGSVEIINSWVENRTNNKIKDLLSKNDIDGLTYLILTNAIYFKSDWKYQFDSKATDERDFTLSNKDHIKVDTMHMCDESKKLNYTSNSEIQLLQLPYKDDELSMYILLPIDNDITSIETELSFNYLTKLKEKLNAEWVDLYLPKFKLEQKYDLKENLIDMGMPTAFGSGADFSGITSNTWLHISKVIHQSFVEVDEKGTEAAAATAVIFRNSSSSIPNEKPIEFKADHPFIFFIEHRDTGQILFMGKVEDPSV
jgi:serpin B